MWENDNCLDEKRDRVDDIMWPQIGSMSVVNLGSDSWKRHLVLESSWRANSGCWEMGLRRMWLSSNCYSGHWGLEWTGNDWCVFGKKRSLLKGQKFWPILSQVLSPRKEWEKIFVWVWDTCRLSLTSEHVQGDLNRVSRQLLLILPNLQNPAPVSSSFMKLLHNSSWSLPSLNCTSVIWAFNRVPHSIIYKFCVQFLPRRRCNPSWLACRCRVLLVYLELHEAQGHETKCKPPAVEDSVYCLLNATLLGRHEAQLKICISQPWCPCDWVLIPMRYKQKGRI